MRKVLALLFAVMPVSVFAQSEADLLQLFRSIRPDVTVVIREHVTTAEDVEITMLDPNYPKELLQQQVLKLGELIKVQPRGLYVGAVSIQEKPDPRFMFMKARFAVNGLIDKEGNRLHVEPILKAFAGAPAPFTIKGLSIIFDGERPNTETVRSYKIAQVVEGVARYMDFPLGMEVRIRLDSQDPDKITWPSKYDKAANPPVQPPAQRGIPTVFWVLFAIAGLALVLLVYFALLRFGRTARR